MDLETIGMYECTWQPPFPWAWAGWSVSALRQRNRRDAYPSMWPGTTARASVNHIDRTLIGHPKSARWASKHSCAHRRPQLCEGIVHLDGVGASASVVPANHVRLAVQRHRTAASEPRGDGHRRMKKVPSVRSPSSQVNPKVWTGAASTARSTRSG